MFYFRELILFFFQQQLLFYAIIWILFQDIKYKKSVMVLGLIVYEILRYLIISSTIIPFQ